MVELSAGANAEIKYSTVQNWYAGNEAGVGGIYNFVTKRGLCHGAHAKISWTQVRGAPAGSSMPCSPSGRAPLGHTHSIIADRNRLSSRGCFMGTACGTACTPLSARWCLVRCLCGHW